MFFFQNLGPLNEGIQNNLYSADVFHELRLAPKLLRRFKMVNLRLTEIEVWFNLYAEFITS